MKRMLCILLVCLLCLAGCAAPQAQNPPSSPPSPPVTNPVLVEPAPSQPAPTVISFNRDVFPRLDGSTSTAPLGRAIASVLLGESEDAVDDLIQFSRTTRSFRELMYGNADLLIVAEPSPSVFDELDAAGFEIQMEPFANDGLIFVVNANNPVDSLTVEQLQGIYSGEITNWRQVGGDDLRITPFQRNAESGSQVLMEKLVMDGITMLEPLDGYMLSEMGTLMEAVRSYENTASAIGYSVFYYANDMRMADGLKILSIDGVAPSAETIRSGEYSLRNPYYVVKAADTHPDSMTSVLYDWILSEDGQRLVSMMGYASVLEVESSPVPPPESTKLVTVHWDMLESPNLPDPKTTLANRWYDQYMDDLIPSEEYGPLVPYIGNEVSNQWWGGGWYYGLATQDGTIVTDPVFLTAAHSGYYDQNTYCNIYPEPAVLRLSKPTADRQLTGLAAEDGSWYTGLIYTSTLSTSKDGLLMAELNGDVVMLNWSGQEVFRWPAESITLPDFDPEGFMWHNGGTSGHWLRYDHYYDHTTETMYSYFVDLRNGTVRDTQPADWSESGPQQDPGAITFGGGWYVPSTTGDPVELHLYNGKEIPQYPLPKGYRILAVDGDRVLLYQANYSNLRTLTDLDGNVIAEDIPNAPNFVAKYTNVPSLLSYTIQDSSSWHNLEIVLDRDGNELLIARDDSLRQFANHLTFADDDYYRLTDLEGNDLIRIPRFPDDD